MIFIFLLSFSYSYIFHAGILRENSSLEPPPKAWKPKWKAFKGNIKDLFKIVMKTCLPHFLVSLEDLRSETLSEGRGTLELPCKTESIVFPYRHSRGRSDREMWVNFFTLFLPGAARFFRLVLWHLIP